MIKGWAAAAGDTSEEGTGEQEGGILDVVGWDRELGSRQRP